MPLPEIQKSLKEGVLEGFIGFKLAKAGETSRVLKFDFQYEGDEPRGGRLQVLAEFRPAIRRPAQPGRAFHRFFTVPWEPTPRCAWTSPTTLWRCARSSPG